MVIHDTSNALNKGMYRPNSYKTRLTYSGYHIDITTLSNTQVKQLENELTLTPYILEAKKEDIEKRKIRLFEYSPNRLEIIVPRYYGVTKFGAPKIEEFDPEDIDVEFTGELREKQKQVCDRGIEYMKCNGGGLLSVPCGFGKTVCAIYMAQRLGFKTLIIVHKSFLLKQWTDSIVKFLNIDESKIGIIRQNTCDIIGKDFVIGMIQTISKRDYSDMFKQFGLVIYDEAHHVACQFYSKTLRKAGIKNTLALTATPYRGDRMIKIMYWYLGGTIYRERVKINKNMIVKIINHRSTDKKLFVPKKRWFEGKLRADTGKMTTNICKIETRNKALLDIITHIVKTDPDRKILVLSGRVAHLDILKNGLNENIKKLVNEGVLDENEINVCMYIGKTSQTDRSDAEENGDVIFATYDMANEGLDIKRLNTVIFASPKKDVMQSVGRILRTVLKSGDVRPMVIDFADTLLAIGGWLKTRTTIYKECKYNMEHYYLENNKYMTSLEYSGMTLANDDLHHKQIDIHNIINLKNKHHNLRLRTILNAKEKFKQMDQKFIKNGYKVNEFKLKLPIDYSEYIVLEDFEHTTISDILYVPKLTDSDIDIQVIKDVDKNNELNIGDDMKFDEIENEQNMKEACVIQALHNNFKQKKMTRSIFKKYATNN